ncbi:MAG: sigma-70 family RNA polymerase sigma factor, partial [Myxococcales bacterium]|nr:sigma-70 family RNA polymerase sigma factor [Myxococcales bacterium]
MPTDNDPELFARWAAGDRAAGAALVDRHYGAVERFFATKAPERVEDLVQQTFLACVEAAGRYRGEAGFRAFLFGVARNLLFEHIRRRVRDGRATPDLGSRSLVDLSPGVSTVVSRDLAHRQLVLTLQELPLDLQTALELYYWEELSIDELAAVLDVPPGTVKSRLF